MSSSTGMKIEVFICLKIRALSIVVDVNFSDSIQVVKWRIYKKLYIPPDMQVLRYHDKNLENDKTLQYYKIEISSTIYLMPEGNYVATVPTRGNVTHACTLHAGATTPTHVQ